MEAKDVADALRARWWMPLVGMLLGAAAAVAFLLQATPLYTSTIQFFVSTRGAASASEVLQGGQFSQQRVTSYAELLQGRNLATAVIERLDLDETPEQLTQRLTVTALPETVLIDVSVEDPSPAEARRIAQALGREFTALVARLEQADTDAQTTVTVEVTEPPVEPDEASSPQLPRVLGLGLLAGLALGAVAAVVRGRLDRTVKDPEQASELAAAPVIGTVLEHDGLRKRHLVDRGGTGRAAEDYRRLRTNLQFLNVDHPPKVILVSSPLPEEGKSTTVVNLALALADAGRRVTVVEADLRRPRVTAYLDLVAGAGLTNVLSGGAEVSDVLQKHGAGELYVLAAGPTPPNPGALLGSSHMSALLEELRAENDFVLLDSPPLLPVADSTALATHTDGVLLTVRYGRTRREQVREAAAALDRVGARTLGVVLNVVPPKAQVSAAHAYGAGYDYRPDREPPA
ncbi:polysaccharide biosynthesis tyrosine autokinase [Geodermatophilus nigrescens]